MKQLRSSNSFISLKYEHTAGYMINTKKRKKAGTFYIGGSEWYDERSIRNKETLFAPGPILRSIDIGKVSLPPNTSTKITKVNSDHKK